MPNRPEAIDSELTHSPVVKPSQLPHLPPLGVEQLESRSRTHSFIHKPLTSSLASDVKSSSEPQTPREMFQCLITQSRQSTPMRLSHPAATKTTSGPLQPFPQVSPSLSPSALRALEESKKYVSQVQLVAQCVGIYPHHHCKRCITLEDHRYQLKTLVHLIRPCTLLNRVKFLSGTPVDHQGTIASTNLVV